MDTNSTAHSLERAQARLARIREERKTSEQAARDEAHAIPFGQPNIEGRGDIYKHVRQQQRKAQRLAEKEERAADRVDMLDKVAAFKEKNDQLKDVRVTGRTAWANVGAATSVNNLDYFRSQLTQLEADNKAAKAYNKIHKDEKKKTYGAKITQLKKKIAYLEQMQQQADTTPVSDHSQQLINDGIVSQWQKKPIYYFIKGLRKVAVTLDENGDFQISRRYPPRSEQERQTITNLLAD
jgi:hypothetical protein